MGMYKYSCLCSWREMERGCFHKRSNSFQHSVDTENFAPGQLCHVTRRMKENRYNSMWRISGIGSFWIRHDELVEQMCECVMYVYFYCKLFLFPFFFAYFIFLRARAHLCLCTYMCPGMYVYLHIVHFMCVCVFSHGCTCVCLLQRSRSVCGSAAGAWKSSPVAVSATSSGSSIPTPSQEAAGLCLPGNQSPFHLHGDHNYGNITWADITW